MSKVEEKTFSWRWGHSLQSHKELGNGETAPHSQACLSGRTGVSRPGTDLSGTSTLPGELAGQTSGSGLRFGDWGHVTDCGCHRVWWKR